MVLHYLCRSSSTNFTGPAIFFYAQSLDLWQVIKLFFCYIKSDETKFLPFSLHVTFKSIYFKNFLCLILHGNIDIRYILVQRNHDKRVPTHLGLAKTLISAGAASKVLYTEFGLSPLHNNTECLPQDKATDYNR